MSDGFSDNDMSKKPSTNVVLWMKGAAQSLSMYAKDSEQIEKLVEMFSYPERFVEKTMTFKNSFGQRIIVDLSSIAVIELDDPIVIKSV